MADDSRFCSHCGELQKHPQTTTTPQNYVSHRYDQIPNGVFGINISKQVMGIYLIWLLLHFILLLLNWNTSDYTKERFWPFSKHSELGDYDFSEFLLYTLIPLIVLVIVNLLKKPKDDKDEALQLKYDLTYERDNEPIIIGVTIIILSLGFYFAVGKKESYENPMDQQIWALLSVISLIMRIGITVWVVNIAKKLNRDSAGWGFFAFFFPSIALIIIGQKRKLKSPQQ